MSTIFGSLKSGEHIRDSEYIIQPKNKLAKNPCFGRISESFFNELKSLDDLIEKIGKNEQERISKLNYKSR
jgi:hypothetical protein